MSYPLSLKALIDISPKAHHDSIRQAFEIGRKSERISQSNNLRESLRMIFKAADMDIENVDSYGALK